MTVCCSSTNDHRPERFGGIQSNVLIFNHSRDLPASCAISWACRMCSSGNATTSRHSTQSASPKISVDLAKTNVNGGAIAIGHPLGASGARIMTTLVNALEQRGGRYGLQTMCEGGGMANATIIERLG